MTFNGTGHSAPQQIWPAFAGHIAELVGAAERS
jgi:hypothetical protein